MKTFPILRENGSLLAFEVTSCWVTFAALYSILRSVNGVTNIKRNWFCDDRISFEFNGEPFVVNEPWGDNSRYWVGSLHTDAATDISPLHQAFLNHRNIFFRTWLRVVALVQ